MYLNHRLKKTSRREFLLFTRQLLLKASVLTICPLRLRAMDMGAPGLKYLDASCALLLAEVSRLLFPHDSLPDKVYLDVVRDIETDMRAGDSTGMLIKQGMVLLNSKVGGVWQSATLEQQLEALTSLQHSEWFVYLHKRSIESLYRHPQVWKLIGYEGSSVEYGGYLHRGFNDIDWLV